MTRTLLPTDAELAILDVLWRLGSATVREIYDELRQARKTGYTTTLKTMQVMAQKGLLARDDSQRSHIYTARGSAESVQKGLVHELAQKAFAGSASQLVVRALSSQPTTPEELDRIRRLLDELEGGRRE